MAKGPLFLGPISGKVGNVVAYHIKYSADKETQAVRAYVSDVANPKTEPQAIQRMKMAPAVNFYRGLSEILDNAWQGERYGTMSRRYFMSLAMKQDSGIPFIPRGEKRFYPGQYRVSQGSLPSVSITGFYEDNGVVKAYTTIAIDTDDGETWGKVSESIIAHNFGLADGDKITFVFAVQNGFGEYFPLFKSIFLDTQETTIAETYLRNLNLYYDLGGDFFSVGPDITGATLVAAAVIVSRLDAGVSAKWLRSNAVMACTTDYLTLMMGSAAYADALASYMSSDSFYSDWYLNLGLPGNSSRGGGSESVYVVSVQNTLIPSLAYQNVQCSVAVLTMSDGTKRAACSDTAQQYLAHSGNGGYGYYIVDAWKANLGTLRAIQAVDADVTGFYPLSATVEELPE